MKAEQQAWKLAQPGKHELRRRGEEIVHLRAERVDLGPDRELRTHQAADGLDSAHDSHTCAAVESSPFSSVETPLDSYYIAGFVPLFAPIRTFPAIASKS